MSIHDRSPKKSHEQKTTTTREDESDSSQFLDVEGFFGIQRTFKHPNNPIIHPNQMLKLQRTIGNKALQRLIKKSQLGNVQDKNSEKSKGDIQSQRSITNIIQRGEASVHEGIEASALKKNAKEGEDFKDKGEKERFQQMYAGNWMRDHFHH